MAVRRGRAAPSERIPSLGGKNKTMRERKKRIRSSHLGRVVRHKCTEAVFDGDLREEIGQKIEGK